MNRRILTFLLILGVVLISGCVEEQAAKPEQVVQPRQENKIITPTEIEYDQKWIEEGNVSIYTYKRKYPLSTIAYTIQ